jgi:hypothetical protein
MQFQHYYAFLALDLARERAAEARAQRLATIAEPGEPRPGRVRRAIARAAIAIARAADDEVVRVPVASH